MEHHVTWFTTLLNKLLGTYVTAFLHAIGVHPHDAANPIPEYVAMSLVVFILMAALVLWLKPRLSVEKPGGTQQVFELLLTNPMGFGIRDLLDENVHHGGRKFVSMVGSISIFLLVANLLGIIPAFTSPTVHPSVPLAAAIVTFLYFNWQGMRALGAGGYAKSLSGPVWWLAWLIFPVELISVSARLLSLTVRLWANMFASELIYIIFLGLFVGLTQHASQTHVALGIVAGILPATFPLIFVGLHIFVAIIQTFVFTILPSIYLGMATAEEH